MTDQKCNYNNCTKEAFYVLHFYDIVSDAEETVHSCKDIGHIVELINNQSIWMESITEIHTGNPGPYSDLMNFAYKLKKKNFTRLNF